MMSWMSFSGLKLLPLRSRGSAAGSDAASPSAARTASLTARVALCLLKEPAQRLRLWLLHGRCSWVPRGVPSCMHAAAMLQSKPWRAGGQQAARAALLLNALRCQVGENGRKCEDVNSQMLAMLRTLNARNLV